MPSFTRKPWQTAPVIRTLVPNSTPWRAVLACGFMALMAGCGAGGPPAGPEAQTPAAQAAQATQTQGPEALVRMGEFARERGDLTSAISLFRQAHAADPESTAALISLGGALAESGALEQSAGAFRSALRLEPGNPAALRGLGNAQIGLGEPEVALESLRAALEFGENANLLNSIGVAQDHLGRHDEARTSYGRALELSPGDLDLASNLALSKSLSGEHGAAVSDMRLVASAPSATDRHRYNLALVLFMAGDVEAARTVLARDRTAEDSDRAIAQFARWQAIADSGARAAAIGGGV